MKPAPSSTRLFSKCAQSTMSRASSLTPSSSNGGATQPRLHVHRDKLERVNFALAAVCRTVPVEWIAAAAEVQPQRDGTQLEFAPQCVEQVATIALGELIGPVAEHDEAWRPRLHLCDVAELDALALWRRRRVCLGGAFEPAVELSGRNATAPCVAQFERDLEDRVDALPRPGGDVEQRHVAQLRQPPAERGLDPVEQRRSMLRHVPFVERDDQRAALIDDLRGDPEVLRFEAARSVEQ